MLLLAGSTACSEAPWTQAASPDAIVLRWYPDTASQAEAQVKAGRHCGATGRTASLAATNLSGSIQTATYLCR